MSSYDLPPVQRVSNETLRKLPKSWKRLNLAYQITMVLFGFANIVLTFLDSQDDIRIPPLYFKIYACIISYSFVVWTRVLDEVKVSVDESTPKFTPATTPRVAISSVISASPAPSLVMPTHSPPAGSSLTTTPIETPTETPTCTPTTTSSTTSPPITEPIPTRTELNVSDFV